MDKVKSQLINIATVVEEGWEFNIPIYQRLYVWTEEQVKTLFEDLHTAYTTKKDLYYIGGIITVENALKPNLFDLVDGQQRFTTLWLLSNELGRALLPFTYNGKNLRLQFSIRENVVEFFTSIGQISNKVNESSNDFSDLMQVGKARNLIIQLIDKHLSNDSEKQAFSNFIFEKVRMVKTTVPSTNDLNKLFEALNNRGAQLEHHEILKARLLSFIESVDERQKYAKLWQACSVMDNYIERVIALEIGSAQQIAAVYYNGFVIKDVLSLFDYRDSNKELSLSDVIQKPEKYSTITDTFRKELNHHPEATEDEFEPVRSILSFPQLLLHTLRIFLFKQEKEDIQRINEKELLEIFDKHFLKSNFIDEKSVIEFIETLFEVRYAFDRYVIKWVTVGDQKEEHILKDIYKQNQKRGGQTYLRRIKKEELHGIGLLQSILYHSQQNTTQYWLTPFLYWMIDETPGFNDAFLFLRHLDNTLLSSNTEEIPLPERTIQSMKEYLKYEPAPETIFGNSDNPRKDGTAFPHYWFYKIEFVLWYYRNKLGKAESWKDYKMTARNSIEHIGPQNPRAPEDKVCTEMLDTMGNLVLVTRSINSEYSDKAFGVKKSMFIDKKSKGSIDSLKSDLIYEEKYWNDIMAKKHFEKIEELLNTYFQEHK